MSEPMTDWRPILHERLGAIPDRIVAALKADIAAGRLAPETRLPTHRRLAEVLGVGVGAVTRAYAEAEAQGLVTAHVGRGSFVASAASPRPGAAAAGPIDLSHNVAPFADAEPHLAEALARLRRSPELGELTDYPPPAGFEAHRRAAAAWLGRTVPGMDFDPGRLICTAGAQQAIAVALGAAIRPGEALVVEAQTFAGVKTLAAHMGYRLAAAAMDGEGLTPEGLDRAAASR
jgi:DNA-binding transcriptional MocR family regulator